MERSVLRGTKNLHNAINDQSCKLKNSWWQNYLFHVCMLTFLTLSWEFSVSEFFVWSSVLSKFQEGIYCYLAIILWKCKNCLIWVLNKSILFSSNSVKCHYCVICTLKKSFYYSLIWKNSLKMSVLLDINSVVLYCSPVTLSKCQYYLMSRKVCSIVWE